MGKILKYCPLCQKSFTQDFTYCPNCASALNSEGFTHSKIADDDFNVTLFEEKSRNKRYTFILGASVFVMSGAIFSIVASIYNKDVYVKALDESLVYVASFSDENPLKIEELDLPQNRKNGDGSGGGGGGRKDKQEVSKGELPPQFKEKPLLTPSKEDITASNPSIPVIKATKGPKDLIPEKRNPVNGMPNSTYNVPSDGYSDSNLGMGKDGDSGIGIRGRNGVGSLGNEGIGNNLGDKYGDRIGGSENGDDRRIKDKDDPPKIKESVGETIALKILSKPRAIYTEAARKNERSGTVTLRVTFMANGSIGNIVVVSGLPDGLTEQAIAAAKTIQFEPAKKNGSAVNVTRQVQYTFTMY